MFGVEQQGQRAHPVDGDVDAGNVADLALVGDRADRTLVGLKHAQADTGLFGQDCPAPPAGAKRADRRERQRFDPSGRIGPCADKL